MAGETVKSKLRSIILMLEAHPDNEPNSEFEDRISDLREIISSDWANLAETTKEMADFFTKKKEDYVLKAPTWLLMDSLIERWKYEYTNLPFIASNFEQWLKREVEKHRREDDDY